MTAYFVTRHDGAVEWLRRRGQPVDVLLQHLGDVSTLQPGDRVYGTLPINLVAEVCARGARYWHLVFPQDQAQRGLPRTADEMEAAGACLVEYTVQTVPPDGSG